MWKRCVSKLFESTHQWRYRPCDSPETIDACDGCETAGPWRLFGVCEGPACCVNSEEVLTLRVCFDDLDAEADAPVT